MTTAKAAKATPETVAAPARKMTAIPLSEPIRRGKTEIAEISIRKPKSGELRGLSIQELMNARVSAVLDILPRITMPPLTAAEVAELEPEDLSACAGAVIDFFLTAEDRTKIAQVTQA